MNKQKGNVLFLILLAVALFAALSYAVTQSNRGGGAAISEEQAETFAAQLIQYASLVESEMQRKRLIYSVKDFQFDVSGDRIFNTAANSNCTNNDCKMFDNGAGTIPSPDFDLGMFDLTVTGYGRVIFRSAIVNDIGTAAPELVLMVFGLKEDVCRAVNERLDVYNAGDWLATEAYGDTAEYAGDLTAFPSTAGVFEGSGGQYDGHLTFCFAHTTHAHIFVHVLIPR